MLLKKLLISICLLASFTLSGQSYNAPFAAGAVDQLPKLSAPELTFSLDDVGKVKALPLTLTMPEGGDYTFIEVHITYPAGVKPARVNEDDNENLYLDYTSGDGWWYEPGSGITLIGHPKSPCLTLVDNFDDLSNWPTFIIMGTNLTMTPNTANPNHVLTLYVTVDQATFTAGDRDLLAYVKYIDSNHNEYEFGEWDHYKSVTTLHFGGKQPANPFMPCDANDDRIVDIDDVNAMINHMIRRQALTGRGFTNADSNRDGVIDVDDLNAAINLMVKKGFKHADPMSLVVELRDGERHLFPLAENPELTIDGDELKVASTVETAYYSRAQLYRIYYEPDDQSRNLKRARRKAVADNPNQYAVYIYRNDNDFSAHLNLDVESIRFSAVGTDSVWYDNALVQEVWTADTVFRTPVNVIDSVTFQAPKPEIVADLFYLRDYHASMTLSVDSLTLHFSEDILNDSLPSIGQVIISATQLSPFEEGFAGKVVDVQHGQQDIVVTCSEVAINDIFRRLILVGKASTDFEEMPNKAPNLLSSDPWVNIEDNGVYPLNLDEKSFSFLNGLLKITSPYPRLTCTYYVYVSEVYYEIYARADLYHRDLSYKLTLTTDQLCKLEEYGKFFKALTIGDGIDEWLNDYMNSKLEKYMAEEKQEQEDLTKNLWKKHKIDIPIIGNGIINLSLNLGPLFKLKGSIEAESEFTTDAWQSMNIKVKGFTPYPRSGYIDHFEASSRQDPFKSSKLDVKLKGSATIGLTYLLNVNLVHRKVLYAGLGGELGLDVGGTINVTAIDTEQPEMNLYDRLKDTQLKITCYAKAHPEIGVSPLDVFHLSGPNWKLFSDEKILYVMPHFTEPELPKFGQSTWLNKDPLSLYSYPSKDVFLPCKIGMRVTDSQGKMLKEYINTNRYLDELDWRNTPLSINISDLPRGASYKCYPTISFFGLDAFNAGPVHNVAVPLSMVASPSELTLAVGESSTIDFLGGWDTFAVVISGDDEVASIVNDGDTDARHIKVIGKKVGTSALTIEDRRTGEKLTVPITVTEGLSAALTLESYQVEVSAGSTATVGITNGSGNYEVESDNDQIATAYVFNRSGGDGGLDAPRKKPGGDGEGYPCCVVIQGISPGTATATVTDTDTQTGQTADIHVTVTEAAPVQTRTYTANGVSFKMVAVQGDTFTMGATSEQGSDAYDDEKPAHQVTLSDFSIGETEVTQELWVAVMGSNPSYFSSNQGYTTNLQRPVENVSWNDCQTFITKLNQLTGESFRLPTEAEWEYAARGGKQSKGYKYAGSNTIGDVAWYWDNIPSQSSGTAGYGTQTVATKSPNELGIYDMSGNVWEWCQDWYGDYSGGSQTNPTGPTSGSHRVRRGGSWDYLAGGCRVSDRRGYAPSGTLNTLGLRLAL